MNSYRLFDFRNSGRVLQSCYLCLSAFIRGSIPSLEPQMNGTRIVLVNPYEIANKWEFSKIPSVDGGCTAAGGNRTP